MREPTGPRMRWANASDTGGCNFCSDRWRVLVIESRGGFQVRACPECLDEIAAVSCHPRPRHSRNQFGDASMDYERL